MRITGNSYQEAMLNQMNLLTARQYKLQSQAATGQRIQAPEDDPGGLAQTLNLQAQNSNVQQYAQNISTLQTRATAVYNSLDTLKKISNRVGEIAISADGTKSPENLRDYATELNQ